MFRRKPASITITLDASCVVRPGDLVVLPVPHWLLEAENRAGLSVRKQMQALLPEGAHACFVPMAKNGAPVNLSRSLKEVAEGLVCDSPGETADDPTDNGAPEPLRVSGTCPCFMCNSTQPSPDESPARVALKRGDIEAVRGLGEDPDDRAPHPFRTTGRHS